jgi:CheY-like chemotaxis protein
MSSAAAFDTFMLHDVAALEHDLEPGLAGGDPPSPPGGGVGAPTGGHAPTFACDDRLVLIIEDDIDVRQSLAEVLEDAGYQVVVAANGREGLERLRQAPLRPFVILLDMMMPEMDGWEFRQQQQRDEELVAIAVVVITAHTDAGLTARRLKAAGFLGKPIKLPVLLETLAHLRPAGGSGQG